MCISIEWKLLGRFQREIFTHSLIHFSKRWNIQMGMGLRNQSVKSTSGINGPIPNLRLKNSLRKHSVPQTSRKLLREYVYLFCILINVTSIAGFMTHVPSTLKIHCHKIPVAKRAIQFQQSMHISPHFSSMRKSQVMVMTSPDDIGQISQKAEEQNDDPNDVNANSRSQPRKKKKYTRKRPQTRSEQELIKLQQARKAKYEELRRRSEQTNIFAFESLFPDPVFDVETVNRDLFEVSNRDALAGKMGRKKESKTLSTVDDKTYNQESKDSSLVSPKIDSVLAKEYAKMRNKGLIGGPRIKFKSSSIIEGEDLKDLSGLNATAVANNTAPIGRLNNTNIPRNASKIDLALTRMVEDRLYGFRRDPIGDFEYDISLVGDGAVQFRDGVRLGNALKVNIDRFNYFAKRDLAHGKLEEAEELYEMAINMAPYDGRAYLGLSRIAQRRRDFQYAKGILLAGISNSMIGSSGVRGMKYKDMGANPFLLQALGSLEETLGHLAEAEQYYISAVKSRPSHAAAWVSLAQLRTRKLRQGPNAGRLCYQRASTELSRAGLPPSSYVNTAWASLEWKAGDYRKARELFEKALEVDPKCSAALCQLAVMEAEQENWSTAKGHFERLLKHDQRNSRALQAYAIMETKRPDGDSRLAIELFERALKVNPRDGGVYQAYALYVSELGDVDMARKLLKKGTEVDKRHSALWQAWGVLETRQGKPAVARDIFQQGIWSCAQPSGGQSGGRQCARLWQAWGVLESKEKEYTAARRCFSRALDADTRNVAAVTAWTLMEEKLGNYQEAKVIFERALRQFGSQSEEKSALWRAYELMEMQAGNINEAQEVYRRSLRDLMKDNDNVPYDPKSGSIAAPIQASEDDALKLSEVEVSSWKRKRDLSFRENAEVWVNAKDGSIEGKVPMSTMKKKRNNPQKPS